MEKLKTDVVFFIGCDHLSRSGKQNIAEGSQASGTSKKTGLKLMNVARASLERFS